MGVIRNGIVALSAICSIWLIGGLAGCAGTEARTGDTEVSAAAAPVVGSWPLDIEHAQRVMRAMFEQRAELVDMPAGTPPE